jgi:hypothetical protein
MVEIAEQGRDAARAQLVDAATGGGERDEPNAREQCGRNPQAHVTATDDQHALPAKAPGQCAEGTLV